MADKQPSAPEDALHLELEHVGVGIDAAVDAPGLDQISNRFGTSVTHGLTVVSARRGRDQSGFW
jgi:hypothetical protein